MQGVSMFLAGTAVMLLPLFAQQTPSDVFGVHQSNGKWYGKNIGTQPIMAYVVHTGGWEMHVDPPNFINTAPSILDSFAIEPGKTIEIHIKPTDQLEIPAVILADGTVLGSAVTKEGMDVVKYIFDEWRAEATELRHWAAVAAQRPAQFQDELERTPKLDPAKDTTWGAEYTGISGARAEAMRVYRGLADSGRVADLPAELSHRATQLESRGGRAHKAGSQ